MPVSDKSKKENIEISCKRTEEVVSASQKTQLGTNILVIYSTCTLFRFKPHSGRGRSGLRRQATTPQQLRTPPLIESPRPHRPSSNTPRQSSHPLAIRELWMGKEARWSGFSTRQGRFSIRGDSRPPRSFRLHIQLQILIIKASSRCWMERISASG